MKYVLLHAERQSVLARAAGCPAGTASAHRGRPRTDSSRRTDGAYPPTPHRRAKVGATTYAIPSLDPSRFRFARARQIHAHARALHPIDLSCLGCGHASCCMSLLLSQGQALRQRTMTSSRLRWPSQTSPRQARHRQMKRHHKVRMQRLHASRLLVVVHQITGVEGARRPWRAKH